MNNSESKKSFEELPDEALDAVAGGGEWAHGHGGGGMVIDDDEFELWHECCNCHAMVTRNDAKESIEGQWYCNSCWAQKWSK